MQSRAVVIAFTLTLVVVLGVLAWLALDFDGINYPDPRQPGSGRGDGVVSSDTGGTNGDRSDAPVEARFDDPPDANGDAEEDPPALPEFVIEGQVLDDDGSGIAGAEVTVKPYRRTLFTHEILQLFQELEQEEDDALTVRVVTNRAGFFRLALTKPGEYMVEASAVGRSNAIEAPVRVGRDEPSTFIFFTLPTGASVTGTLLDESGRPIPGVAVFLLEKIESGARAYYTHRTRSNSAGAFEFHGLEPRRYLLMAKPRGTAGKLVPNVVAPAYDIEMQLDTLKRFLGRVVDATTGDPIAGVLVTAANLSSYDQTTSDSRGLFELMLNDDDADVILRHAHYVMDQKRITLDDPESDPELFELSRGAAIDGRLLFGDLSACSDMDIGVLQEADFLDDIRATRTDIRGRFTIAPVDPDKRPMLLARVPGWTLPMGSGFRMTDGDHVLAPTESLTGVVVDGDGNPLREVWVRLLPGGSASQRRALSWLRGEQETWTDERGRFHIADVIPANGYIVELSHSDKATRRVALQSFPDGPVELTLAAGGAIEGRLVPAAGSREEFSAALLVLEVPGAPPVRMRSQGGILEGGRRIVARSDGTFFIDQVPEGDVTIHVQAPTYLRQTVQVKVAANAISKVTIPLRRAVSLSIELVDTGGDAVAGAPLVLRGEGPRGRSRSRYGVTNGRGVCRFQSIPAGTYTVYSLGAQGSPFESSPLESRGSPLEEITVDGSEPEVSRRIRVTR